MANHVQLSGLISNPNGAYGQDAQTPILVDQHTLASTGFATSLPMTGTSGAPTSGTWQYGQLAIDSQNRIWVCTASGTPGNWQLAQNGTYAPIGTAPGQWAADLVANFGADPTGATDSSAAISAWLTYALNHGGGFKAPPGTYQIASGQEIVISFTPNANYIWTHIDLTGTVFTYSGTGTPITLQSTLAAGAPAMFDVKGGYCYAPNSTTQFWLLEDVTGSHWERVQGYVPNGSIWTQSNVAYWCERNQYIGCIDGDGNGNGSMHALSFIINGSSKGSMARTVVRDLWLQGGVPGQAKINLVYSANPLGPGLYDSIFDGLRGNIKCGVIVMTLAANMRNIRFLSLGTEAVVATQTARTVTWNNNASTYTGDASASSSDVGQAVTGAGVPNGCFIVSVNGSGAGAVVTTNVPQTSGGTIASINVGGYNTAAYFSVQNLDFTHGNTNGSSILPSIIGAPPDLSDFSGMNLFAQGSTPWGTAVSPIPYPFQSAVSVLTYSNAAWPIPPRAQLLRITCIGGGGGGGGAGSAAAAQLQAGAGAGAAGDSVSQVVAVGSNTTLNVTIGGEGSVGTGGNAGGNAGTNGTSGGSTTVTASGISLFAKGGPGGIGSGASSTTSVGGGVYGTSSTATGAGTAGSGGGSNSGGGYPVGYSPGGGGGGGPATATNGGSGGNAGSPTSNGTAGSSGGSGTSAGGAGGAAYFSTSASLTANSNTITVTDASGIVVGQYVTDITAAGHLAQGAQVVAINGTTITLSGVANNTAGADTLHFYNPGAPGGGGGGGAAGTGAGGNGGVGARGLVIIEVIGSGS
jgi:hypothetical protein